jgi:alkaline phosphatase D
MSDARPWPGELPMRTTTLALLGLLAAAPATAQEVPPLTRITFGSCADQERPQPIWDAVLAYKPELFLFAGDNVYGDVGSPELAELREAYARAGSIAGFERVRREVPHLATWDDHDYGRNDAGAEFAQKAPSQALFLDFWQVPADDPRRGREGVHASASFGPEGQRVQVILLDTRFFRSPLRPTDQRGAPGNLPLAASPHRPAWRAGQGALPAGRRPGEGDAGRGAMGLAR